VTDQDPVLQGLAQLPLQAPPSALSEKLRSAGHARLVPAKVHPAWSIAIACSVLAYLGWALLYTNQPY
jgi:hypothetical protein